MIDKKIIDKEKKYLQSLVDNGIIETKRIEYKQSLPGDTAEEKIEFLADVSSLANTIGGDLIYGIVQDKETDKPIKLEGIEIQNIDNEIQRLENMIRDGIQPRILAKTILPLPLSNSRVAIIIRIAKSWISPHRVTFRGHDKFYARNSNGKYQMDVDELRIAFNFAESIKEKIRNFHLDRIAKINANETPIPFVETAKVVLHLVPINSFASPRNYDLSFYYKQPNLLHPIRASSWHCIYNFDGIISYFREIDKESHTYVQLYRNGIIEAINGTILSPRGDKRLIYHKDLEKTLTSELKHYLLVQKNLGLEPFIVFYLSLLGVKGYSMIHSPYNTSPGEIHEIDRDILNLPEILIDNFEIKPEEILKPHFDLIWNACGYPKSPHYDNDGKWKLKSD